MAQGKEENGEEMLEFLKTQRPGKDESEAAADKTPKTTPDTLFTAAQNGRLEDVKTFLGTGKVDVNSRDLENCTALHWASINNHIEVVKILIDAGADVNAVGGNLLATPLQWASRTGHVPVVLYLVDHGADLDFQDNQGYNVMHLAVHAGLPYMVLLFLGLGMDVDTPDSFQRTPLMWACYIGNNIDTVSILLTWGGSLERTDLTGYTSLHWAIIASHYEQAKLLLEAGADVEVMDPAGKTPVTWARERETLEQFERTMVTAKRVPNGNEWAEKYQKTIPYLTPFIIIPIILYLLSHFKVIVAVPIALVLVYAAAKGLEIVLFNKDMHQLAHSPVMTAIPQATLFVIFISWLRIFFYSPYFYNHHISFLCTFCVCVYCLYRSIRKDPGYIPKLEDAVPRQRAIMEVARLNLLDARHYCITCSTRKPLRSKHCKSCDRCVAKFDHHCPWTYNCIGALNYRDFVGFIATLVLGSWIFITLVLTYLEIESPNLDKAPEECMLFQRACEFFAFDGWALIVALWGSFNAFWVMFLFLAHVYQIAVNLTTNEMSNYWRYDYLTPAKDMDLPSYRRGFNNPFDRGPIMNCLDVCGDQEEWLDLHAVPETQSRRKSASSFWFKIMRPRAKNVYEMV